MAQKAIQMTQIRQVQRLRDEGVAIKEIVRRTGISRKTVKKYLRKLEVLPVTDDGNETTDKSLAPLVYDSDTTVVRSRRQEDLLLHFSVAARELHKTGVTKQLLWMEYNQEHPDGYQYSQYCYWFTKYLKDTDPAFHWEHTPGEFTQADFAGKKLSYVDQQTGLVIPCEVFISVLPFSGLLFCEAARSQQTADFAHCINAMSSYYGGVTRTILCDNFRTAVTRSDRYEPIFTELCYQLSDHYQTTFSATRPGEPRDKGMVEKSVAIVYNHIYARMRKLTFHSLESLNKQIRILLDELNHKPYKNSSESRRDIFNRSEKEMLKALPEQLYRLRKGKQVMVQQNYAIQLPDNKHYYTVPYQFVGYKVWVQFDPKTVEVYFKHELIAFHARRSDEPMFNRIAEHMPANHQHMVEVRGWTVEELSNKAGRVGQYTRQVADRILHSSIYPEQNFKACNAMIQLQTKYSKSRLEAACKRAADIPRPTLKLIRNILEAGLDSQPLLFEEQLPRLPGHSNIRGAQNYQ